MREFIQYKVRQVLTEARIDAHAWHRIKHRIDTMSDSDLPKHYRETIMDTFFKVRDLNFPKNKSYAILLGKFTPKSDSEHYVKMPDGREYYRVFSDPILKDSTGNQFWVIVRDNKVHTFMLRKDVQTRDADYNNEKLNVDATITNIDRFISDMERSKIQKVQEPIVNIGGVKWKIDPEKETIFKKNKPEEEYPLMDFVEKLDAPTQEKIFAML